MEGGGRSTYLGKFTVTFFLMLDLLGLQHRNQTCIELIYKQFNNPQFFTQGCPKKQVATKAKTQTQTQTQTHATWKANNTFITHHSRNGVKSEVESSYCRNRFVLHSLCGVVCEERKGLQSNLNPKGFYCLEIFI